MLPSFNTFIFLVFSIVFACSMLYYVRKVVLYKNDERGHTIIARASVITFGFILLVFAIFIGYVAFLDVFDLPHINNQYSMTTIKNFALIIMCFLGTVHSFAIRYYEKIM